MSRPACRAVAATDEPMEAKAFFEELARPAPGQILVHGQLLRPGCRVRLQPRPGGDILDSSLAGQIGLIESFEQNERGELHVAVILQQDPGRDLAAVRHPAHRFLFALAELEPLSELPQASAGRRVLVAGIGNIFFGDDGFGCAVARRLEAMALPAGLEVRDFGIRGLDLAYALGQRYDAAILLDAIPSRGLPGNLRLIRPQIEPASEAPFEGHRMEPVAVLRLAAGLAGLPSRVFLLGCEVTRPAEGEEMTMQLSAPVAAAVEQAAQIVVKLGITLLSGQEAEMEVLTDANAACNKEREHEPQVPVFSDTPRGAGSAGAEILP